MPSYLFSGQMDEASFHESFPLPNDFVRSGGAWIGAAGSALLASGRYALKPRGHWIFCALEEGEASLAWPRALLTLTADDACFLPPGSQDASVFVPGQARMLWICLEGPLAPELVRLSGALLVRPLPQRVMLGQMLLLKQIVRIATRCDGTNTASFQLAQMLYGMLSIQCEQPIAPGALISQEIFRVLDTLREGRYRDNPSLAQLAEIACLPTETFRKRFVAEVGIPPLQYVLAYKMARAKAMLLTPGWSVGAVAAEVGIGDPYRFSKQFKSVVGISPTAFVKLSALPADASGDSEHTQPKSVTPPQRIETT